MFTPKLFLWASASLLTLLTTGLFGLQPQTLQADVDDLVQRVEVLETQVAVLSTRVAELEAATPEPTEEAAEADSAGDEATEETDSKEVKTDAATAVTDTVTITTTAAVTTTEGVTENEITTDTDGADDGVAEGDIVDILVASGNYKTLLAGLDAAGLVDALRTEGPFTIFAPTDAAFEALEEAAPGALQELLADPGGQLTQILLYHVASGELLFEDITTGMEVATIQEDLAMLELRDDSTLINSVNISDPDLTASNGVVHGIDAVLIPPSFFQ